MTPTTPEIETEKKSDDAVTLVPVPGEQRKASLIKRMDHKAASLGTTVEIVLKQSLNEKYGKAQ